MHFYTKCLLIFGLCIFGYLLLFTGNWFTLKRIFTIIPKPELATVKASKNLLTPIERKVFANSKEYPRFTKEAGITRLLNELDLLEPKLTVTDPRNVTIKDLVLVTGWSSSHQEEAKFLCPYIKNYIGFRNLTLKLIVYDLGGITPEQQNAYKANCSFAEWRTFATFRYPYYVANLLTYRWKPLIIAEMLTEFPLILWVDSSMEFRNGPEWESFENIISSVAKEDWRMKLALFGYSSHSIFAATDPRMYKFLTIPEDKAKASDMWEASNMMWMATAGSKQRLLRPWVECALIDDCMGPMGAKLFCQFSKDHRNEVFANCHRYDQSAISIIASVQAGYNYSLFSVRNAPLYTNRRQ